ncbi:MAG: LysE family transporter [Myxococcota bacterium]|nr:LysE family transporter [Myxococcota bacterium]
MSSLTICAIALGFGFFGSMPLAGPIAIMVLSRAAAGKLAEAIRIALGAAVAEGIYAGLAFWGFTTFLARHEIVVPISHGVTAVVLVALGARFVFWKLTKKEDHRASSAGSALLGFTVSALNPTLFVTWSAAVAFVYSKGLRETSAVLAIPFALCAATGVASWFLALGWVLKKYEGKLPHRVLTGVVRTLGLVLVGLGVWSGVQLAKWCAGDRKSPVHADASSLSYRRQ